jgi:hypothetical protein
MRNIELMLFIVFSIMNLPNLFETTHLANAQQNSTKYTAMFSTSEYETCSKYTPDYCTDTITVIYESPSTVVLSSEYGDVIWSAVDIIKKDGYKLEGFTSYAAEAGLSSGSSIHTTVVMSK